MFYFLSLFSMWRESIAFALPYDEWHGLEIEGNENHFQQLVEFTLIVLCGAKHTRRFCIIHIIRVLLSGMHEIFFFGNIQSEISKVRMSLLINLIEIHKKKYQFYIIHVRCSVGHTLLHLISTKIFLTSIWKA